jgi:hypothetical protein
MSRLDSSVADFAAALSQQTDKLNELVTTEVLLNIGGAQAAAAYLQQVAIVKEVSAAHQQAVSAVRAQQTAAAAWQKSLSEVGKSATAAFTNAAAFSKNLAATANPTAWETMQDSLQLVTMQLGISFLPTIVTVSYKAQEFAHWLEALSPEAKQLMTYVAGAAGALYAFSKAASAVNTATFGLGNQAAKAAAQEFLGASLTTKIGVFAVGAAAFSAAKGLWDLVQAGKDLNHRLDAISERREAPLEEKMNRAEFENTDAFKTLSAIEDPDERRKRAGSMSEQALRRAQAAAQAEREARSAAGSRWLGLGAGAAGMIGMGGAVTSDAYERAEKAAKEHEAAVREMQSVSAAAAETVSGSRYTPSTKLGAEGLLGAKAKQAEGLQSLLVHMPKESQPHFSAVEEARKQFQMGALKDPLEQEMLRLNREAAQEFLKLAPALLEKLRKGEPIGTLA